WRPDRFARPPAPASLPSTRPRAARSRWAGRTTRYVPEATRSLATSARVLPSGALIGPRSVRYRRAADWTTIAGSFPGPSGCRAAQPGPGPRAARLASLRPASAGRLTSAGAARRDARSPGPGGPPAPPHGAHRVPRRGRAAGRTRCTPATESGAPIGRSRARARFAYHGSNARTDPTTIPYRRTAVAGIRASLTTAFSDVRRAWIWPAGH